MTGLGLNEFSNNVNINESKNVNNNVNNNFMNNPIKDESILEKNKNNDINKNIFGTGMTFKELRDHMSKNNDNSKNESNSINPLKLFSSAVGLGSTVLGLLG